LRWYLEKFFQWPIGVFKERAEAVEQKLPVWGKDLFTTALGGEAAHEPYEKWKGLGDGVERRFSVQVDCPASFSESTLTPTLSQREREFRMPLPKGEGVSNASPSGRGRAERG